MGSGPPPPRPPIGAGPPSRPGFPPRVVPRGPRVIDRPRSGFICRLIDENGEQLGILDQIEAKRIADERGLDLVEMAATAKPPTCKLMDFGKFKYNEKKKSHGQKKGVTRRKEIKLRPKTEENDFNIKLSHARRFLGKGHKVLVTMVYRGRETVHLDLGKEVLVRFAKALEDCAKLEKEPAREGRNKMNMILAGR